jgi:hypothetical protein
MSENELDFNGMSEEDAAWAESVGREIRRLGEVTLGRSLLPREEREVVQAAIRADATGQPFDAHAALLDHYVERGDSPPDKSTPEGRTQFMAELMREGIAAEKEEAEE